VFILTITMMLVEISAGFITGSMALLADGWHMGTHSAAFGISIFAYRYARRNQDNARFSFGPGKVTTLGGFASAVALAVVALFMIIESIERFFNPVTIQFNEAIIVAVLGLVVNVVSAVLLMGGSVNGHAHHKEQHDHNLRSAYFHVLADALTSLLAIAALLMGKYLGWQLMDPVMGIVGALVILNWSRGLLASSGAVLLDRAAGGPLENQIRKTLNAEDGITIADLRIWCLAPGKHAAAIQLQTGREDSLEEIRTRIESIEELAFLNIELQPITGAAL